MLLELNEVGKTYEDRRLFRTPKMAIYDGDRIGLVGRNGAGKTTLLRILTGQLEPDEGWIKHHSAVAYIAQTEFSLVDMRDVDPGIAGRFGAVGGNEETMSGGEKTRCKIAAALSRDSRLLIADEPTANLDIEGTELLQKALVGYSGALVMVSHDRELLDALCNIIWELDDGGIKIYSGGYSDYIEEKEAQYKRREKEYEQYVDQKRQLEVAIIDRTQRAMSMRKTPKRMGNSEARLHKMGNQKAKANLDKSVKGMETRLAKLELKEKPKKASKLNFDLEADGDFRSRVVVAVKKLSKSFGERTLFKDAGFTIYNGQKVAIVGGNGSGKTTLLRMILSGDGVIYKSPSFRPGYFSQELDILNPDKSILDNVMATSVHDEGFVRPLLARLLVRGDEVYKKVCVLSGGEKVRVSLAKLIASDANVLILDEPTNYLDLFALEAIETVLAEYTGTILLVSHDRKLINSVATHLLFVENQTVRLFAGNYAQYLDSLTADSGAVDNDRVLLEYRMADIIARLSIAGTEQEKARLDAEYQVTLTALRDLQA